MENVKILAILIHLGKHVKSSLKSDSLTGRHSRILKQSRDRLRLTLINSKSSKNRLKESHLLIRKNARKKPKRLPVRGRLRDRKALKGLTKLMCSLSNWLVRNRLKNAKLLTSRRPFWNSNLQRKARVWKIELESSEIWRRKCAAKSKQSRTS